VPIGRGEQPTDPNHNRPGEGAIMAKAKVSQTAGPAPKKSDQPQARAA